VSAHLGTHHVLQIVSGDDDHGTTTPAAFHRADAPERGTDWTEPAAGPMDLVCRRIAATRPLHYIGGDLVVTGFDVQVRLPNPNYPGACPPVLRHHSSDDSTATQSWGYAGSGPADLALNVLAAYCPISAGGKTVKLWDGHLVSDWAERYHHAFNRDFLESLPEEGGVITEAEIRSWLRELE
jgi:hypothetical protein